MSISYEIAVADLEIMEVGETERHARTATVRNYFSLDLIQDGIHPFVTTTISITLLPIAAHSHRTKAEVKANISLMLVVFLWFFHFR